MIKYIVAEKKKAILVKTIKCLMELYVEIVLKYCLHVLDKWMKLVCI